MSWGWVEHWHSFAAAAAVDTDTVVDSTTVAVTRYSQLTAVDWHVAVVEAVGFAPPTAYSGQQLTFNLPTLSTQVWLWTL